jgi:hypothetical protein
MKRAAAVNRAVWKRTVAFPGCDNSWLTFMLLKVKKGNSNFIFLISFFSSNSVVNSMQDLKRRGPSLDPQSKKLKIEEDNEEDPTELQVK